MSVTAGIPAFSSLRTRSLTLTKGARRALPERGEFAHSVTSGLLGLGGLVGFHGLVGLVSGVVGLVGGFGPERGGRPEELGGVHLVALGVGDGRAVHDG